MSNNPADFLSSWDGQDPLRLFVAVDPPPPLVAELGNLAEGARRLLPGLRWVHPERFHLTMRFLGPVPVAELPRIREAVERAAAATAPMALTLSGWGGFPNLHRLRVLWLGVESPDPPGLPGLAVRLEELLPQWGEVGRPFQAHLTMARARHHATRVTPATLAHLPLPTHPWPCSQLILYHSDLSASGPSYTPLHTVPFTAPP